MELTILSSKNPKSLNMCVICVVTECDQTFVSGGEEEGGAFSAPELLNPGNHSRQCLYTFLAGPGQRVEIIFTHFDLRGAPQELVHTHPLLNLT